MKSLNHGYREVQHRGQISYFIYFYSILSNGDQNGNRQKRSAQPDIPAHLGGTSHQLRDIISLAASGTEFIVSKLLRAPHLTSLDLED